MKFNIGDRVFVKYFNKFGVITKVTYGRYIEPTYAVTFDYWPNQTYNIHEPLLMCAKTMEYKQDFEEMLGD